MNASELKFKHELHSPESFYFSRDTMKFFGDTMSNFAVVKCAAIIDETGELVPVVYVLSRKKPTKKGAPAKRMAVFHGETFRQMHEALTLV